MKQSDIVISQKKVSVLTTAEELKELLKNQLVTDDTEVYFDDIYYPMVPAAVDLVKTRTGKLAIVVSPERG